MFGTPLRINSKNLIFIFSPTYNIFKPLKVHHYTIKIFNVGVDYFDKNNICCSSYGN